MDHVANDRIVFSNHTVQNLNDKSHSISNKSIWIKILEKNPLGIDCPFLYSNFISVPSIIPSNAFNKVGGYPELIYSGEHISLWGKLYFKLNLELFYIEEVLYECLSRHNGNRFSNIPRHVSGKCEQFINIAQLAGIKADNYVWVAEGNDCLHSLYAPVIRDKVNIPSWASVKLNSKKWLPKEQDNTKSF